MDMIGRIRRLLYVAALIGTRFNQVLKTFYAKLQAAGKPRKSTGGSHAQAVGHPLDRAR